MTTATLASRARAGGHSVAEQPDLPSLIEGPDVLIGGGGRLVAVFDAKATERRNVNDLLVRLALCRLGLPRHTACVLLAPADIDQDVWQQAVAPHFDLIVDRRNRDATEEFATEPLAPIARRPIDARAREVSLRRTSALLSFSSEAAGAGRAIAEINDFRIPEGFEPVEVKSWTAFGRKSKTRPTSKAAVVRREGVMLGWAMLSHDHNRVARLVRLTHLSIRVGYLLDYGVPHLNEPTTNVLMLDETPPMGGDPLKAARAAALAGWAVVPQSSASDAIAAAAELEIKLRREGI